MHKSNRKNLVFIYYLLNIFMSHKMEYGKLIFYRQSEYPGIKHIEALVPRVF
ncbi:hypothetical protein DCCM_4738 [Desulfocucumis palustris]|uniref:Uncharacterized protein n=1 Tax=Desulfocucumis palustris TaxID=1898651 RepID=A0A2L2XGW4_9FIRM|nr:hypothetical protein DCCM_4738 [Desulfocucumis palustris]